MTLRKYLLLVGINVAISWVVAALIIFFINPLQSSWWIYFFLYICIFVATGGLMFLLNFNIRLRLKNEVIALRELRIALREGVLFGLLVIMSLFLSHYSFLEWWNFLFMILGFLFIEILFIKNYN